MNNQIIEEKVVEFGKLAYWEGRVIHAGGSRIDEIENWLRTALLEADQAGYARAMGEARKILSEKDMPPEWYVAEFESLVSLSPTDNNKDL